MEMDPGKLFIGGISWNTNEDQLRQYFQNFGDVVEAVIMKDRTTGRARGFGFIVFADPSVAERVVMKKHVIDGRTVEAKKAVPRDDQNVMNRSSNSINGSPGRPPISTKKIFVGGLASTVTESDFKKYFDQFGTITDVVVMYDHNTQRPRGFGFITYDSEDGVEKVLYKTFHELNGKMVEVKRAVPKESSPGPSRGYLGGYSSGLSRVSNGSIQGYNPSLVGGHGLRMDGRLSPVTVGHSGYHHLSPNYGAGLSFEPTLSKNGHANFTSTVALGRVVNPSYNVSLSRYNNSMGHADTYLGNSSTRRSANQNLLQNGNLNYATKKSAGLDAFVGYGSENSSMDSFGSIRPLWSSPFITDQARIIGSGYNKGSLSYSSGDVIFGSEAVGYGKSSESIVAPTSFYALSDGSYDGVCKDTHGARSFYGNHTWGSSTSELEAGSHSFGLGNIVSDLMSKSSGGEIGVYSVASGQSNRGIAA